MRKRKLTLGTGTLAALKDMIEAAATQKQRNKRKAKAARSKGTTSKIKRDQG
jgi:hypothetical protein